MYPATKQFISHGYGISVTPLQIVSAYSVIANDGYLMRPFVVKEIYNNDGSLFVEHLPQKIRRVVSHHTCETLKNLMVKVVEEGTGKNAKIYGINIAGKTGTAQKLVKGEWIQQYYASFAGFFPAENPKIVMLVVIDNPQTGHYGGVVAAPIFKRIAQRWIAIQSNILANFDYVNNVDSILVPNVKGFFSDNALKILRNFGFDARLYNLNDGIIIKQDPEAGSILKKGEQVIIYAKNYETLINDTLDKKSNAKITKPFVIGMPLKLGISVLHKAGIKVKVNGSGIIKSQIWTTNEKRETICILNCKFY